MPQYAKEARKRYDRKEISAEEMIRQVYMKANDGSDMRPQPQHFAKRCIQALFKLTNSTHQKSCLYKDIRKEANYQNLHDGFYVWQDLGCGIVEQDMTLKQYWIKDEFRNPLKKVLEAMDNKIH